MWKYIGSGFIPGVPSRDLTDEEAAAFDEALLIASGLYEHVSESKPLREIKITTRQHPSQGEQEKE